MAGTEVVVFANRGRSPLPGHAGSVATGDPTPFRGYHRLAGDGVRFDIAERFPVAEFDGHGF